jgi:hypothetical protein
MVRAGWQSGGRNSGKSRGRRRRRRRIRREPGRDRIGMYCNVSRGFSRKNNFSKRPKIRKIGYFLKFAFPRRILKSSIICAKNKNC